MTYHTTESCVWHYLLDEVFLASPAIAVGYNRVMTAKALAVTALLLLFAVIVFPSSEVVSGGLEASNVLWVEDDVCIAGQPTEADFRRLKEKGVRSVVNLRRLEEIPFLEEEERIVSALGMKYFHVPVEREAAPPDSQYEDFLKIAREPSNRPVFYHCGSGSRVAGFWMIYRVRVDGWSLEKAEEEARRISAGKPEPLEYAREYLSRTNR